MTRKRKELIWTSMALAGIGLGALVAASAHGEDAPMEGPKVRQEGERRRPAAEGEMRSEARPERPDGLRRLFEGVNLTEEQKPQVRAILQEGAEKARAFHEEHKDELQKLREEARAAREAGDREKMKQIAEQYRAIMEKGPRGETIAAIKAILTPEQLVQFEANVAKAKEAFQHRMREGRPKDGEGEGKAPRERRQPREGDADKSAGGDKLAL